MARSGVLLKNIGFCRQDTMFDKYAKTLEGKLEKQAISNNTGRRKLARLLEETEKEIRELRRKAFRPAWVKVKMLASRFKQLSGTHPRLLFYHHGLQGTGEAGCVGVLL